MIQQQRTTRGGERRRAGRGRSSSGFTLVELVVTVLLIALLVGLLVAALGGSIGKARTAKASAQFQSIGQAIEVFKQDFDGTPPPAVAPSLLAAGKQGLVTPESVAKSDPSRNLRDLYRDIRYHSEYTIVSYLIGVGRFNDLVTPPDDVGLTANDSDEHDGVAGPGYKNPGPTLAWKNPISPANHQVQVTGRTYGPYLDLASIESLLQLDEETQLYKLLDPWGSPIRYYRNWPTYEIDADGRRIPTLTNVPIELRSAESVLAECSPAGIEEAQEMERDILAADYALLSSGTEPDQLIDNTGAPVASFGDVILNEAQNAVALPLGINPCTLSPRQREVLIEEMLATNVRYAK